MVANCFADRGYTAQGTLVPRSEPGAFIHDETEAIERVIRMIKEGKVRTNTGEDIEIKADSVCVHGDNPKAVEFVTKIKAALINEGIEIVPVGEIV
ncbi:MAG: LamB/YcsF family protein [Clostridia bacterium]|nr:LamB/YcsF family protein [Clostridia bacterium]